MSCACVGFPSPIAQAFRSATLESPLFFGPEKATFMRKLTRHLKSVVEEIAAVDKLLVQEQLSEDDQQLHEMRMAELVMAKKQLDIILCFANSAAKHGVSSSAFAKSVSAEMHRMTLPPVVDPVLILPSCMLLAHFKCSLEECSHDEFWRKCRVSELKKFSLPSSDTPEGLLADIIGNKIAQYTKGAKANADIKSLEAWLERSLWQGVLPPPLEEQVDAVARVVSLACEQEASEPLSPDDIGNAVALVSDSKNTLASTLLLYLEGRGLVEAAKKAQSSRVAAVELQRSLAVTLSDASLTGLDKLKKVFVIVGTDGIPQSWKVETLDVQRLWSEVVSTNIVDAWQGWHSEHGLDKVEDIKATGATFEVENVDHLKAVDEAATLHSGLAARWPDELKDYLGDFNSEALKGKIFACHQVSLEQALEAVDKAVPASWRKWGGAGLVLQCQLQNIAF